MEGYSMNPSKHIWRRVGLRQFNACIVVGKGFIIYLWSWTLTL
jgi:hypothetical protein